MKYDRIIYDFQTQADRVNTIINKRHKLDEELSAVQDELYAIFQDIEHNMRDYDLLAKIKTPDVVVRGLDRSHQRITPHIFVRKNDWCDGLPTSKNE